ncbi:MAG TPA: hypothetical protein VN577_05090 [Terriglobales bacterium]|nr:hypothetical protein [Terriglobales bacterium]
MFIGWRQRSDKLSFVMMMKLALTRTWSSITAIKFLLTVWIVAVFFMSGCGQSEAPAVSSPTMVQSAHGRSASSEYLQLLSRFSVESPGFGPDAFFEDISDQPMAVGLLLQAEDLRYRATYTDDSKTRIRAAVRWLFTHADDDHDGTPGWGLPEPWDAFSDGSSNPANQPYTITTALALEGLLDAAASPELWNSQDRAAIQELVKQVVMTWCEKAWSTRESGGFFWYSTSVLDAKFVPNVSAMMSGVGARLLREHPNWLSVEDRKLLRTRIDDSVRSIINTATIRDQAPFWTYNVPVDHPDPNDLVHHVYILWGLEVYRAGGGTVPIPWMRADALRSIRMFWRDGTLHQMPADVTYGNVYDSLGAEAWGAGMALAFTARWGSADDASAIRHYILTEYGEYPDIRRYPGSQDTNFYRRWAAHMLWGIAVHDLALGAR